MKSIGWGKYKLSAVYRIANDIDASASQTETFRNGYGKGFKPIGKYLLLNENYLVNDSKQDTSAFSGKIHGGGHVIKDLNVGYVDYLKYWTGFIDGVASSGLVDSLSFTGYSIKALWDTERSEIPMLRISFRGIVSLVDSSEWLPILL